MKEGAGIVPHPFPKFSSKADTPRRRPLSNGKIFPGAHFLGASLVALGRRFARSARDPVVEVESLADFGSGTGAEESCDDRELRGVCCNCSGGVQFVDVAKKPASTSANVWGGVDHKRYIIEAKGSGLAFFDYDNDGWLDIYLTNGTRFDANWPPGKAPTSHLYKNNRDGTFTDVTEKSGLARTGWQTGVCVGDYDNDGWDDLFCCFWGHNILFHNNGDGTFTDVTRKAGLYRDEVRWGSGCTFLDYDRDGHLDLFVCNYIKLDPEQDSVDRTSQRSASGKAFRRCAARAALPGDTNILYHNNGDGTFTDVSDKAGILKPGPRYSITAVSYDFDNDGWPDIYVAVDSAPSILFKNNHDGTFTDIAVIAGWPTAKTATNRPAWVSASLTTTATAGSIFSKPISPMIPATSITTMATAPSAMSRLHPAVGINNQLRRLGLRLR